MTPEDKTEIQGMIADALTVRFPVVLGPDGKPVQPAPPRAPFDWSGLWATVGPYVFRIVTIGLAAIAAYFGVDASKQANVAATHAETAAVQSQQNSAEIKATHKTVSRIVGAAVQE